MENGEEINLYPRNSGAMSSSSESMIFPVTALYLFVSREEREGGSSFTRKGQVVLDRGPMANTDTIEDIKLIKDLPHKFYPVDR